MCVERTCVVYDFDSLGTEFGALRSGSLRSEPASGLARSLLGALSQCGTKAAAVVTLPCKCLADALQVPRKYPNKLRDK